MYTSLKLLAVSMFILMIIPLTFAYTPPAIDSIDLVLDGSYTPPAIDSIDLVLGEAVSDNCWVESTWGGKSGVYIPRGCVFTIERGETYEN